jgi:GntR family transcriptional regulator/MocR family aminotransferase
VGSELLVELDRLSASPLHEQLAVRLREAVRSGRLTPGEKLPSSRLLAGELGVSRGVVIEAYAQLTAEGYLTASQGAPTRVSATASTERPPLPAGSLQPAHAYRFDPGLPDLAGFPRQRWLHSLRMVLRETPFDQLGYGDPRGTPELRNQLMAYLGRVRGAAPEPEHTIICAGFAQGFAMLCRTLRDRGIEQIGIEDPGSAQHRLIAERAGLHTVAIAVDAHGIRVTDLAGSECEAMVLTPAHQFPTGVVLASERRAALLEWVHEHDGLIVEDDFDSELRYDRSPIGSLQGLAPERVCQIGSTSLRLFPALRLGWLLSPSWLTGALTFEKGAAEGSSPVLDELALAAFIAAGELDRHLRRARLRYRQRREVLLSALQRALPTAEVTGIPAGVYAQVLLPEGADEDALVRAASKHGVDVEGVGSHRFGGPDIGRPALVLGFGNLSFPALEQGIGRLGQALAEQDV